MYVFDVDVDGADLGWGPGAGEFSSWMDGCTYHLF